MIISKQRRYHMVQSSAFRFWMMILCGLLGSCGFQLRGTVDIPDGFLPIYIRSGGAVGEMLTERLIYDPDHLAVNAAQARLIIDILTQKRQSHIVAVDREGKALAYELRYVVTFQVQQANGQLLIAPETLQSTRIFDDNPDVAVLGKQLESEIIYRDLIRDAADRIALRLRAVLHQVALEPPTPHSSSVH
jgi:LPS-assembly lipoprotein